ncbi:MAG: RNA polymerase sigma factor [Planctomycetota bacterium]
MTAHPFSLQTDRGTGPKDLVLVQAALRGEEPAVGEILSRLSCVVRFVFRLNRTLGYGLPTEGLEDVVQQVYLAIWPRLRDYAGTAALETWVYGFCRNCLRAEVRRRLSRLRAFSSEELGGQRTDLPAPEDTAVQAEGLDMLQAELDRLEPLDREIVVLRHLQEWSFEQIAQQKDLPVSTVKDRCYRALDKIRFRMTRQDKL